MGHLRYNELTERAEAAGHLPWLSDGRSWSDFDDAQLDAYIEREYGITKAENIRKAWMTVLDHNRYNPVEE